MYTKLFVKNISGREKSINFNKTNKDVLREQLVDMVISEFSKKAKKEQLQFLTLPSAWWNFEKLLVKRIREENINFPFYTIGCEKESKIFRVACTNMPRTYSGFKYVRSRRHDAEKLRSGVASLYYMDIFDYIRNTDNVFDFIWLDLMTSLKFFDTKVHHLDNCTRKGSLVSITFLNGRDGKKYIGKRKVILSRLMKDIDFELIQEDDYYDTSPMIQLTFKKK